LNQTAYAGFLKIRKSLLASHKINLIGLANEKYADIRYDSDGDGSIDFWLVRDGDFIVMTHFIGGKLADLTFQKNSLRFQVEAKYIKSNHLNLTLASVHITERTTKHNTDEDHHITCNKVDFEDDLLILDKINSLVSAMGAEQFSPTKMIDNSCSSDLIDGKTQKAVERATAAVYSMNLQSTVVDNIFIKCLNAGGPTTEEILPRYIDILTKSILSSSYTKIICSIEERSADSRNTCTSAELNQNPSNVTKIKIYSPPCSNIEKTILKDIFHEALHPIVSDKIETDSEKRIIGIVNSCVDGRANPVDSSEKPNYHVPGPSATIVNAQAVAQNQPPADVPTTIASPPISTGDRQGIQALNAGFSGHGLDTPTSTTVAYENSRKASSGILEMANQVFSKVVVPTAFASNTTAGTNSAGVSNSNSSPTVYSPNRSISSVPNIPTNPTSNTKSLIVDQPADTNTLTPTTNSKMLSGTKQRDSKETAGSSNTGANTASSAQASGRNVASDGFSGTDARSGGSGSADAKSNNSSQTKLADTATKNKIQNLPSEELTARRNSITQSLTQKSPQEAWNYIYNNSAELDALGIQVLDSKNKVWGHKNPKDAPVIILERNNRLTVEVQ
jgi:hypothetical protein